MISKVKKTKALQASIFTLIAINLIFAQTSFGGVGKMLKKNKIAGESAWQKEINSSAKLEFKSEMSEAYSFDADPYTLIDDAIAGGFISETPDMYKDPEFLSNRVHYVSLPKFTSSASPSTMILGSNDIDINQYANDFDLVIVFNTSASGVKDLRQVGYVFEKNISADTTGQPFTLTQKIYISSGLLENDRKPIRDQNGVHLVDQNGSLRYKTYWKGTEAGYFPVSFVENPHESHSEGHPILKYFIGFNPKDGQGMHYYPTVIHHRTLSHGCLRVEMATAKKIYGKVVETFVGRTKGDSSPTDRYVNKLTGVIKTVAKFPIEIASLNYGREKSILEYNFLKNELQDDPGNYNIIGHFRALYIVNGAPNMDYSDLAYKKKSSEVVTPNEG